MSTDMFMEAYDKLAKKYTLVLERLGNISTKLNQTSVNIEELRQYVSDTITEVTLKSPI